MSIIPNVNDLKPGQNVKTPVYYVESYVNGVDTFTPYVLNYGFDEKVSVVAEAGGKGYEVEVLINGVDELLFTGTVDGNFVIPKAVALECGALFESQVIDLSAGPMSYARYLELGTSVEQTGAYLITMTGSNFTHDLATMDTFASIAMVDISKGTAVLKDNAAIRAGYVEIAGGSMRIDENLVYGGDLTLVSGWVKVVGQETATFTGVFNDLGNVYGPGTLDIVGGKMSVGQGAAVGVKTWQSKGSKTSTARDYIDDTLKFAGNFIVGADTEFTFYKKSSLTVNEINNINGAGGTFTMADVDPTYNGDETIDVLGRVAGGEAFNIGSTDVLQLGDPQDFHGVIDSMTMGTKLTAVAPAVAGGEVALDGIWNFVKATSNGAGTKTIVTMRDVADGLLANIAFAGTIPESAFTFFDQIKGVTPTTIITPTIT